MKEADLHAFWQLKWVQRTRFITTRGLEIDIVDFGKLNPLQGPDFTGAEVLIGSQTLHGSIEFHVTDSEWFEHGHHKDVRYDKVVLHVVWKHTQEVKDSAGRVIPCLELSRYFSEKDLQKTQLLMHSKIPFPCQSYNFSEQLIQRQFNIAALKELQLQSEEVYSLAHEFQFDWERVLFIRLLCYSVDPQNRMPVKELAMQLPLNTIKRMDINDYLPCLLKASGLWEESPVGTKKQFFQWDKSSKLQLILNINPSSSWQHRNLRASGYPLVRIVQFFTKFDACKNQLSNWMIEDSKIPKSSEVYGKRQHLLMSNVLMPFWGARRFYLGIGDLTTLLEFIEGEAYEQNRITQKMQGLGGVIFPRNAKRSYAEMAQYKHFCDKTYCSHCAIGKSLWNIDSA